MNIGQAASATGVSAKMIGHYECFGLLPPAVRTDAGYRQYAERDLDVLRFIRRARDLGFSTERTRDLVDLWQNRRLPGRQVGALAQAHMGEIDRKLSELQEAPAMLAHLLQCCRGGDRPDCSITGQRETSMVGTIEVSAT